ncbi:hypothetical protein [Francisella frigiditurris]|uniref:Uncharacterized protein n=1 Tax=Francisella frigiditurris TaxID=1542390 RepID=A0A1J0KSE3_9GAMM|nr:hypothetical protein [Francisella frigiditurris]APC96556.1 hypothetical protein KX01_1408 [Francisella frigiditurris]
MKKRILIGTAIVALVIGAGFYYYHSKYTVQAPEDKPPVQEETTVVQKPKGYCLIRYNESKDNGKSWEEVVVENGQTPISTDDCWAKYGTLLDKFGSSPDANGRLHGEEGNDLIKSPAMDFSDTPINIEDAHKKDAELAKKEANKATDEDDETADSGSSLFDPDESDADEL